MGEKGGGGLTGPLTERELAERAADERGRTYKEEYGVEIKPGSVITDEDLGSALADGAESGDMSAVYAKLAAKSKRKK